MLKDLSLDAKFCALTPDGTTAGTTDVQAGYIMDVAGYNTVSLVAHMGAMTAAGYCKLIPQFADTTSTTSLVNSSGADWVIGSTAVTTDMTDQLLVLTIHNPPERYVSCKVDKATQNSQIRSIIGIAYNRFGSQTYEPVETTSMYGTYDAASITTPTTS